MSKFKKFRNAAAAITLSALVLQTPIFAATTGPQDRKDIKLEYQWNLADIYSSKDAFQKDFNKVKNEYIPKFQTYKGTLNNASKLMECLKLNDTMNRMLEKLYVYSHMKADENQADSDASEMSSSAETLNSDVAAASSFVQPELLSYSEKYIKSCMDDKKFAIYKHYLDAVLKQKPHTLSNESEEILASASDIGGSPNSIYTKITTADLTFPKIVDPDGKDVQLSEGSYGSLLTNTNRYFRKRAFEGVMGSYNKVLNSTAATLNAEVKKNIFFAKARHYNSAMEAALASENIPTTVYTNLVSSVDKNLSYLNKYISLRKNVLGLDKVHSYDMYVPLVSNFKTDIPYEDAKKMVVDGLSILGSNYINKFKEGLNSRWIDVFETNNKYTGGYQWGGYDTHPFILLNYDNTADSMLTLAHEMGHAMNAYYSKSQAYVNSNVPIFNAEVASTANELLMNNYLIKNAKTDDEKLYYLNSLAETIRGTVYTQVMYAEFEKAIHEKVEAGGALSADSLNKLWYDIMSKYYGSDYQIDDLSKCGWSRIPHFYMDFYVYKYATSISAANQLVKNIESGKSGAVQNYIKFLSAGSSDYPIEVLKNAGVDMTKPDAVNNILADFGNIVDQMETILKKEGKIK